MERQRLDKWLWFARFARTRPLAAKLVADGHVRLNGVRVENGARAVKCGDVLTLALARNVVVIRVAGFAERRGPALTAGCLYETDAQVADGPGQSPDAP